VIPAKKDAFVKAPLWWVAEASKATKTPATLVCVYLLHASWKAKSTTFTLPNGYLKQHGVSRHTKSRVLRDLGGCRSNHSRATRPQEPARDAGAPLSCAPASCGSVLLRAQALCRYEHKSVSLRDIRSPSSFISYSFSLFSSTSSLKNRIMDARSSRRDS